MMVDLRCQSLVCCTRHVACKRRQARGQDEQDTGTLQNARPQVDFVHEPMSLIDHS